MNKEDAETILVENLGGPKKKRVPLTTIGKAVEYLLKNYHYKSQNDLAKKFGISRTIISDFIRINKHPQEIKNLIKNNLIGLDTSSKLLSIKDIAKRTEIAKEVAGLPAHDARYVIDYIKKRPDLSIRKCKKIALDAKIGEEKLHLLVIPLHDEDFSKLRKFSTSKKIRVEEAAVKAIQKFMKCD